MLADEYEHGGVPKSLFEQEAANLDAGRNRGQLDYDDVPMAEVGEGGMYGEDEEEAPQPSKGKYHMQKTTKEKVRPQEYEAHDNHEEMQDEDEEGLQLMSETAKSEAEKEILFWVQGIGTIKKIGGSDVFVKREGCEDCLQSLIKLVKSDSSS